MLKLQHQKMSHTTELADDEVNHFFIMEIGFLEATMVKLREEDVNSPEDLFDFNADDVSTIADDLRKPCDLAPLGGGTRILPTLVSALVVRIGANTLMRLEAAVHIMKYYEMVNLKPSSSLLRYDHIIKNFKLEFDAIKE